MEFFHDHAWIEPMFFGGYCELREGQMTPDFSRSGVGLELKVQAAEEFRVMV